MTQCWKYVAQIHIFVHTLGRKRFDTTGRFMDFAARVSALPIVDENGVFQDVYSRGYVVLIETILTAVVV